MEETYRKGLLSIHILSALQRHYTENSKQIFPEMKLRSLVPNFYIHVGKYKSLTDT